ncbi:MAG: YhdP family protein [Burkholderiales bacterium]|nr:YhdP family protein [Burkholderiales bacterium]
MPISVRLKWLHISSLWVYRILTWAVLAVGFACAAIVLSLRYWVLPNIEQYRGDIAQAVSHTVHQRVTIGKISANWDGMRPELVLENVILFDAANQPALELPRVDNTLSWLSLLTLELRFYSLEFHRPVLNVKRDARGTIWVAGIALTQRPEEGDGVADWLLRQREIVVRDAEISWLDEMRGAPQLDLKHVGLRVENRGDRHRFGLRAVPPPHLASPLDLRGDLRGDSVKILSEWNGNMFVQLDYADIAAWRTWVPYPIEFPQGAGALRLWLDFSQNQLQNIVADVRLADVRTRLAKDLPELELIALSGRVAWKSAAPGFEFSSSKLSLKAKGGLSMQSLDFLLRITGGDGSKPERGELKANALDFEPLVALADRLPFEVGLRQQLVALAPRGSLYDVDVRWTGEWREPSQYSVRGRFQDLALKSYRKIPGFSGISGNIDGNEKAGALHLNTGAARLDMPLVFREPLQFEAFTAQLGWLRGSAGAELRMNSISFSNQHLAGTLFGSYRMPAAGGSVIDLTGNLTRADARYGSLYVPLVVGKSARDWLDLAFIDGQSNDVALRLKGNLADFPFADGKTGIFQVVAKVTGAVINYGAKWPRIENVAGELNFRGKRMDVFARQGSILGAKLGKVHAEIPDLISNENVLRVTGEAEGPTGEFLAFIEKSPVNDMVDRFTEGMRAQGNGKLTLKLEIPLHALDKTKVTGGYQLINNVISGGDDLPPLEQANGRLDFSESSVRVQNATGTFMGGPVSMSAVTQRDATVRGTLQGQANFDSLRRAGGAPAWMLSLRGSAPWRGSFVLRNKLADLVLESNLQGVASDLPAPLVKSAAEAVALRIERRYLGKQQDQIIVSYGDIVSANLQRRTEAGASVIRRGNIRLGSIAPEPQRDGVSIAGSLKSLNVDRWLALAGGGSDGMKIDFSTIDLKIGEIEALARRFNDVALVGTMQGGAWRATVSGRELEGTATWQPQGRGKLTARLKKLSIPPAIEVPASPVQPAAERVRELPALDIVADQFQIKGKQLGKLELTAVSEARDWRIERLRLTNPDGALAADGVWQNWHTQPRTQINLQLETGDIGKLLTRLGYPEGVRRGTAKVHGTLAWPGSPQDFDYPQLSGNIVLEAAKGQFVKLEPGIGKLLGILSLQALPRRISLDFRDIFSEGFAFDEILGGVNISRGVATANNFRLRGPSANVVMAGDVDLAKETQKLRVKITPSISDAASIAGALIGGPIAGVAAFLAQKLLKDPLDQMASYEYDVTGTWADPQVQKVDNQSDQQQGKVQ